MAKLCTPAQLFQFAQFARPASRFVFRLAFILALCLSLHAQNTRNFSVVLRDGRTGKLITPSNFLLRVDHHDTVRNEWVKINDDGTVIVTIPGDVKEISLQATYSSGMDYYVDCDAAKQTDKERTIWYPVDQIMTTGIVAPNECSKTDYPTQPGEFVFFVRKRSALDPLHN
jgi:hypothetical protein